MSYIHKDVVTIVFRRIGGVRIIVAVRTVGSARPCRSLLFVGGRVLRAERCLLNNGFRIVFVGRGVLVLERRRRHV